ncbi:MAG: STAS domain-containing protein [Chloroflexota bacterium]
MDITTSKHEGKVPVTVLHINGKLDSTSFQSLIAEAQKIYDGGARHLVLDMTNMSYISSAGLAALHSISLIFQGKDAPDLNAGWQVFKGIDFNREKQSRVKLAGMWPEVQSVLDVVGFTLLFETYPNVDAALASF